MSKVEINVKDAREAYKEASPEIKKTLLKLFGKKVLFESIMDAVQSYEDACEIEGIAPLSVSDFTHLPLREQASAFAEHQMNVIQRVLNEGWTWNFGTRGYFPYFYKDSAAGCSGFSSIAYAFGRAFSIVGARRVFKDEKTAIYAGKQFIKIFEIIHLG